MEPSFQGPKEPRRKSGGCLWGCLAVVVVVLLVFGGLFGFSAWFLNRNIENDSKLQTIMAIVRDDPRAEAVLGRHIHIQSVESRTFLMETGVGKTASYTLRLAGSRGEGTLEVNLDLNQAKTKVTSMVLTGADGHPLYLVGKEPENLIKQSI